MTAFGETRNVISTVNSTTATTFAAGAEFQGVGEDVSVYGRVGVSITTSNATSGTIVMEVSRDNVNWGGPPRFWADTRFAQPHMWNIVEKYFRIKYINGSVAASNLEIQVQYSVNADILLGHQLDETLLDETEAIVTRSVLVGRDEFGQYQNVEVGSGNELMVATDKFSHVLDDILIQLKVISLHLSAGSDDEYDEEDVD